MGLIKAGLGALGGTLADQWKEFFSCDAISNDILMVKGRKNVSSRSSNTKGSDNVISNGSGIVVADGQCMIIVEQGKVVEVCAEPGQFTYDASSEPSVFAGNLGQSILDTFKVIGKRFTYGGDAAKDQRVYYFNTKEILDNKFGTPTPIAFRVVDSRIGFDVDVSLRCNGVYTFRLTDPLKFYTKLGGNVTEAYSKEMLRETMKSEFLSALGPAMARLSELELRPNQIPAHTDELERYLNEELKGEWGERGIGDVKVALNPPTLTEEDQELLKTAQKTAMYRDPTMAGATLVGAQADAMRAAAANEGGAMAGFMGMNMAMGAGANAQGFYGMTPKQESGGESGWRCACGHMASGKFCPECGARKPEEKDGSWKCACGHVASGKFCPECGAKKPEAGWRCKCGAQNSGKFCPECGAKKPEVSRVRCDKCGWEPNEGEKAPRFCPECGDPINGADQI